MSKTVLNVLLRVFLVAFFGYFAVCAAAWSLQDTLIFHPRAGLTKTPATADLPFEDVWLTSADGEQLHGWYIPRPESDAPHVLFFHGNAGNLGSHIYTFEVLHSLGFSVFAIDYRGYGLSSGSPTIPGAKSDAEAAWLYLTEGRRIAPSQIVLYGRSLGGGVAAALARSYQPAAIVLESTFSNLSDMGRRRYPFLPVALLLRDELPTARIVAELRCPVMVAHSPADRVVPFDMGLGIAAAAGSRGRWVELRSSHNRAFKHSAAHYHDILGTFIRTATMKPPAP